MTNLKNTFTEFNFVKTLSYFDPEYDPNAFHISESISEQYNYNRFFNEKNFKFLGEKRNLQLYFDDEEVSQALQRVFLNENNIEDSVHKNEKEEGKTIEKKQNGNIFNIKKPKTPGRKIACKSENDRKKHTKDDYDNINRKIQVHFITFIIKLSNDIISQVFEKNKDFYFRNINYELKKCVNFEHMENLKNLSIKEILLFPVSEKYKKGNENEIYNEIIYNNIINSAEWLSEFFNMNYLNLFKKYYFNINKRLSQIIIKNNIIKLSKDTKSFYELYQENNDERKELLINCINRAYFGLKENEEKNIGTIIFKTICS